MRLLALLPRSNDEGRALGGLRLLDALASVPQSKQLEGLQYACRRHDVIIGYGD